MVLDFLQAWDIGTLILAALVLAFALLAGSFGIALAWKRWKEGKRRRQRAAGPPPGPTGVGFAQRAKVRLPKPSLKGAQLKVPKVPKVPKLPKLPKVGLRRKP